MIRYFRILILCFVALLVFASSVSAQSGNLPFFTVEGEVLTSLKLTSNDLLKFKSVEIRAKGKDGKEHTFKGVRLFDLLDSAGVTLGKELRGKNLTKYMLIKATDGYEAVFSLAEIDPEFTDQTIILAYQVDGNPLPKGEGPFRIVVPNDKRPTRWVREVTSIKILFSKE